MVLAYHYKHTQAHSSHRVWPVIAAIIAFLLVLLWAKPIG